MTMMWSLNYCINLQGKANLMTFQVLIFVFAFSSMYINLLLCMEVYICGLTLSNSNACDIPVSMKLSCRMAPAHTIDFYIQMDSEH